METTCRRDRLDRRLCSVTDRIGWIVVVLLLAGAAPANSGTVDIAWDPATPGNPYEATFDCDTDEGSHGLVVRFSISGTDSVEVNEIEASITYGSEGPVLPAWWSDWSHRDVTIATEFLPGPYALADFWRGRATIDYFYWGPTTRPSYDHRPGALGVIYVRLSMPPESHAFLQPGTSYYAFRVRIPHAGASSVAGCGEGICLLANVLVLKRPNVLVDFIFGSASNPQDTHWQSGFGGCVSQVPVRPTTWSAIKSRY
jgi:hypothetical protein